MKTLFFIFILLCFSVSAEEWEYKIIEIIPSGVSISPNVWLLESSEKIESWYKNEYMRKLYSLGWEANGKGFGHVWEFKRKKIKPKPKPKIKVKGKECESIKTFNCEIKSGLTNPVTWCICCED